MIPKARYMLDFKLMPETIQNQAEAFIKNCVQNKGDYMAYLFNNYFHNMCKDTSILYRPQDFCITDQKVSGNVYILYIELPQYYYDSTVICTAYAVAYTKPLFGGIKKAKFYSVEQTTFGTSCIGTMGPDGRHVNFGDAFPTRAENLRAIAKLYRR